MKFKLLIGLLFFSMNISAQSVSSGGPTGFSFFPDEENARPRDNLVDDNFRSGFPGSGGFAPPEMPDCDGDENCRENPIGRDQRNTFADCAITRDCDLSRDPAQVEPFDPEPRGFSGGLPDDLNRPNVQEDARRTFRVEAVQ